MNSDLVKVLICLGVILISGFLFVKALRNANEYKDKSHDGQLAFTHVINVLYIMIAIVGIFIGLITFGINLWRYLI